MNSLERVQQALNHQETDRVPRLLYGEAICGYVPTIAELLKEKCAPKTPREYFDMDITGVRPNPTALKIERYAEWLGDDAETALASGEVDEWGVWMKSGGFYHFVHIESPLRNETEVARIKEFPWPDLDLAYRFDGMSERIDRLHQSGMAVCAFAGSIFEQAWYIRGMENMLADMIIEPDIAHYMFDRTSYFQKYAAAACAKAGADIIITGDDVASQHGLMMSVETWRDFLKPRLAETIKAVKAVNAGTKVFYHSDGNVEDLIPELIEIGVDILNPVQPECMDPAEIKLKYGDKLSFWGTVSVQQTLPLGTPGDVRSEVRQRIATVGKGGGFILAPAHVLGPETPWGNIEAFFDAAG